MTQLLSSTLFRLRGLEEGSAPPPGGRVSPLLEQAIREVRRVSINLGPCVLEELGLSAALRALARDLQERTGMAVEVSCPELPQALPAPLSWTIYRILQEGVQNIEKHAAATRVSLAVRWRRPWVTAILRDNGKGFACGKTVRFEGSWNVALGLRNIHERAEGVGGSAAVRSSPGQGTVLLLRIPWWAADEPSAADRRMIP